MGHKDRHRRAPHPHPIGEEGRGHADPVAVVGLVADDRDRQVNLVRVDPRRGGDRIKPGHQAPEVVDELLRGEAGAGKLGEQVDEFAGVQEGGENVLRLRRQQSRQPGLFGGIRGFRRQGLDDLSGRAGQGQMARQRVPERDGRGPPSAGITGSSPDAPSRCRISATSEGRLVEKTPSESPAL